VRARHFNRELADHNHSDRAKVHRGKHTNRNGHVPAAGATMPFDVVVHVIVIDGVPMDHTVGMNMGENMAVLTAFVMLSVVVMGMLVWNAVVIAAGASSRSL
jgi:hypothetical protein